MKNINSINSSNDNTVNKKAIVKRLLKQEIDSDVEDELIEMLIDRPISIDVEKNENQNMTIGDKIADKVAEIVGSWPFIIAFTLFLITWMIINGLLLKNDAIDPYPFILLNLLLSCIAALQAPIIMMSQNRQSKKDSLRNQNDYQVDLKSELILEDLHDDIRQLINNQNKIIKYIEEKENINKDNQTK